MVYLTKRYRAVKYLENLSKKSQMQLIKQLFINILLAFSLFVLTLIGMAIFNFELQVYTLAGRIFLILMGIILIATLPIPYYLISGINVSKQLKLHELKKQKDLLDLGIITQEEYDKKLSEFKKG